MEDFKEKVDDLLKNINSGEGKLEAEKVKKAPRKTYDPSKKYRWEPGTKFLLEGEEFGLVLNSLRTILSSPEAQKILLIERASKTIDNALARAVELGLVQEDETSDQKRQPLQKI